MRNSFRNFPAGTIHIIAVNTEPQKGRQLLAARIAGHYFICADNGILGMLGESEPDRVVILPEIKVQQSTTFIAYDLFADVACSLAGGTPLEELGSITDQYEKPAPLKPTLDENNIIGCVIYVDTYQNAITNISKEFFERIGEGRPFQIFVQSKHYKLENINNQVQRNSRRRIAGHIQLAGSFGDCHKKRQCCRPFEINNRFNHQD